MTIIAQLEHAVTPVLLAETTEQDSTTYSSLLTEFYALLVARLALPKVYSDILRSDVNALAGENQKQALFQQLWPDLNRRERIIQELVTTYHTQEALATKLIITAIPLVYHELLKAANGKFLPAFLQEQQPSIRLYLPVWAASVLGDESLKVDESLHVTINKKPNVQGTVIEADNSLNLADSPTATMTTLNSEAQGTDTAMANSLGVGGVAEDHKGDKFTHITATKLETDAIHANPSAYRSAEERASIAQSQLAKPSRYQGNNLWVKILLGLVSLLALALLWLLVIEPYYMSKAEPVIVEPQATPVVAPQVETSATTLIPIELMVAVDDSGNLYSCTARVGTAELQAMLQQALNASFGPQADSCELLMQEGVANEWDNVNADILPNVFTLLRSVPFARLQLQDERMSLEAPDEAMLQRLSNDMRALLPNMIIDTAAPLPLGDSEDMMSQNTDSVQDFDDDYDNNGYVANNDFNNNSLANEPQNNATRFDANSSEANNFNNTQNNNFAGSNNAINNNNYANNNSAGGMAMSEAEELANTTFVAEQLRNESRVE